MQKKEKKPKLLKIIRRPEWGARWATYYELLHTPVRYVILKYFTDIGPCQTEEECKKVVRALQDHHKKTLAWADVAYNFLIGGDGTIIKGRGWTTKAERPEDKYKQFDGKSHEIAFIGDFRESEPPLVMAQAARDLIDYGVIKQFIDKSHIIIARRD